MEHNEKTGEDFTPIGVDITSDQARKDLGDFTTDFLLKYRNKALMMPGTLVRDGSMNAFVKFLSPWRNKIKDGLEIGSFEGSSAMFWLEFFPQMYLTCIDPFTGNPKEHGPGTQFEKIFKDCESRFHANMNEYAGRYTIFKSWSTDLLPQIRSRFGLIYVDGCHEEAVVKFDTEKCWDLCRVDGLILWDDYDTEIYPGNENKLRVTIDEFLQTKEGSFIEVFNSTQCLCIQKIKE